MSSCYPLSLCVACGLFVFEMVCAHQDLCETLVCSQRGASCRPQAWSGGRRVVVLPAGPLLCGKELSAWQRHGFAASRCGQAALPTSPHAGRHLKIRKIVPSSRLSVKQAKINLRKRHCDLATPQEAWSQFCCPGIVLGSMQEEKHLRQVPTETT